MTQTTNADQIILVTGATGNQGGAIARDLLQRGKFKVRAMVRDQQKPAAQTLQQAGAELVPGDFNDRSSLDRALQGVYGVFSIQDFRDGAETEIRQGTVIADAASSAGVQHFVYSSVGSAERNTGIPHFDSKFQVEEHIRAIDLPHTIMRPVFFLYNYNAMRSVLESGTLPLPLSPGLKLQQLSEKDYGAMVSEVLERPAEFMSREIEVASVDLTMTDTAAVFSRVLGKPVNYQQISFDAFEQQVGEEVTIMYRWFENVGYVADLAELKREFHQQTDLESYLRDREWAKPVESVSTAKLKDT